MTVFSLNDACPWGIALYLYLPTGRRKPNCRRFQPRAEGSYHLDRDTLGQVKLASAVNAGAIMASDRMRRPFVYTRSVPSRKVVIGSLMHEC